MSIYQEEVDLTNEARRERAWEEHFSTYGCGVSMFRTKKTTDLVLEGIPGKLRNQVRWLSFKDFYDFKGDASKGVSFDKLLIRISLKETCYLPTKIRFMGIVPVGVSGLDEPFWSRPRQGCQARLLRPDGR